MTSQPSQANIETRGPRAGNSFKRTYKACEACRKTKAKCERDEYSQSCFKCRREQRECIFPAQRSTKRAKRAHPNRPAESWQTSPAGQAAQHQSVLPDVENSSPHQSISIQHPRHRDEPRRQSYSQSPSISFSGRADSVARLEDTTRRSQPHTNPQNGVPITPQQNAALQNQNPGERPPPANIECTESSSLTDNLQDQVVQTVVASSSDAVGLLFRAANCTDSEGSVDAENQDPHETSPGQSTSTGILCPGLNTREPASPEVLELWNQHRFVRQGWFTAREAVAYVQAFFTRLSSLSPVVDSFYADHANHRRLILEEPLLCCTLLMISSRYHHPPGPGGAVRADFIHARLWRHIEYLVQRITFGSEKYSIAKSRTLGSIQALLLITDWHPRSLHFPPENDGWDASLAPAVDDTFTPQDRDTEAGKRWREDVFEPAKRSDRLSWMLVGLATTLAHELGVFRPADEVHNTESIAARSSKSRIRRLLYLYATQLSLRLGCTSVFPQEALQDIAQTSLSSDLPTRPPHRDRELMLSKWIDITKLLTTVTDMFFASRSVTKQILRSTRYISLLDHFQPLLDSWYRGFTQMSCPTIQDAARKILLVDYYYARMYIHSIAIQALVDRISNLSGGDEVWQDHEILRSKHAQDFASVNEVRESSGKILMTAVELRDQGVLRYCPVRLYLRIVSASVFLLKSISLGSREADIIASLRTLDRCIDALQTNCADDIHLSSRYATLMARHVQRFRRNFRVKKKAFVHPLMSPSRSRASSPFRPNGAKGNQDRDGLHEHQDRQPPASVYALDETQHNGNGLFPGAGIDLSNQFNFVRDESTEDWLAQPFNPQIAPFGLDYMQPGAGLAVDSLDFLWNISS
ncbi:uncharacterized protein Z518_03950 [Rhinocladiella mackenziei CBS 650.93]|uniref:Rhinocladiella mackenziei CBS 650.93 unplaced genomic scaffold supercont1.3, whole genome shotgun sequence n=1 Tax=Rhinocladiella mackenziei CBS 650.93 TaxID=1442369 RepID=A0A0D2IS82_9EURO|nr:uncharacterized protein Z518_03950 [Rhinocladiella mackenziei CBS 650.93]KIX05976.1 hypothetical protein Z518_03950 [Rhinocladiella mackenziei CBS 650.93]